MIESSSVSSRQVSHQVNIFSVEIARNPKANISASSGLRTESREQKKLQWRFSFFMSNFQSIIRLLGWNYSEPDVSASFELRIEIVIDGSDSSRRISRLILIRLDG